MFTNLTVSRKDDQDRGAESRDDPAPGARFTAMDEPAEPRSLPIQLESGPLPLRVDLFFVPFTEPPVKD